MKKLCISVVLTILSLTGCAGESNISSTPEDFTASVNHTFEEDDTVYVKAYYYEGYEKYAYLIINASGEIRTGYDERSMHHDEFSDYIAELSQEPATYTLNESETDNLIDYLSKINTDAEWNGLCGEEVVFPDVEVIATYQYLYLDGALHRLNIWNHYTENLEDDNAKAAVSFVKKLDFVQEWDIEVNRTIFGRYSSEDKS